MGMQMGVSRGLERVWFLMDGLLWFTAQRGALAFVYMLCGSRHRQAFPCHVLSTHFFLDRAVVTTSMSIWKY